MASFMPPGKHLFTQCMILLSLAMLTFGVISTTPPVRFEAAFQGVCGEDSPCEQLCFDLHDGTYECSCRERYTLSKNGYSCLDYYGLEADEGKDRLPKLKDMLLQQKARADLYSNARRYFFRDNGNHIYRNNNRFKRRKKLGVQLPWSTSSARLQVIRTENSLQSTTPLSDSLSSLLQPMNTVTITTPPSQNQARTCEDLQCDNGGICEISLRTRNARCMCPLGRHGISCEKESDVYQPKFHGHSYLSFPILRDANLSVLIVLEFRPESFDGLLLYSGEEATLLSDYMAIVLIKGFVEFRFDCGSGEAIIRSNQPVVLYSWNKISIYRERWDAWMQLNNGMQVHGQSQGLYSKITFRNYLYLGGTDNISVVGERLYVETGFEGCIDNLKINDKLYDFSSKTGDVVGGFDIDECDIDGCSQVICLNGGKCIDSAVDEGTCVCALGFTGELCETAIEVMVPFFNNSFLQYEGLEESVTSFFEITIIFKPYSPFGALLYNGDKLNNSGDFIAINLVNSHVEFRFDLGSGPIAIRSPQPVILADWHSVHVTRTGRQAILEVDDQRPVFGLSPGAFTQLTLSLSMFFGGIPDLSHISPSSGITTSFTGCIQKFLINNQQVRLLEHAVSGRNIANCKHSCLKRPCYNGGNCQPNGDSYNCDCPAGYTGTNCQKEDRKRISEPVLRVISYYYSINNEIFRRIHHKNMDLSLRFKTFSPSGLILWIGQEDFSCSKEYLSIGVKSGYAQLSYSLGEGVKMVNSSTRVDDGDWHLLQIVRNGNNCLMKVDKAVFVTGVYLDSLAQRDMEGQQDLEITEKIPKKSKSFDSGLIGSLANLTISIDCHVRLVIHKTTGRNIKSCT